MKTRKIIQFCTMINEGKVNKTHPIVSAYQCKNGLAIGHPVIPDGDNFKYGSGWVIYHVASGGMIGNNRPDYDKTPQEAMRSVKNRFKGKLQARIMGLNPAPAPAIDDQPIIIGKLKPFPKDKQANKPFAGCEKIVPAKNTALLALIYEIDMTRTSISRDKEAKADFDYIYFTIGKAVFRVATYLEALERFRLSVLKKRLCFSDNAL